MNERLSDRLHDARQRLRDDPRHVLPIEIRVQFLRALGPLDRHDGPGHRRRTALAIDTARRALAAQYGDERTTEALDVASTPNSRERAFTLLERHGGLARQELQANPIDRAIAARVAAYEALYVAIHDEIAAYEPAHVDYADAQFGGDDVDTASLASVALAGVAGAADDNPQARLEFWKWWLRRVMEMAAGANP